MAIWGSVGIGFKVKGLGFGRDGGLRILGSYGSLERRYGASIGIYRGT